MLGVQTTPPPQSGRRAAQSLQARSLTHCSAPSSRNPLRRSCSHRPWTHWRRGFWPGLASGACVRLCTGTALWPRDSCFGSREAQGACLHGGRGVSGSWAGPADPCPLGLPFCPFPDSSPCPLPPLQGVSCCPQSLTCTAIFMEDPVSREMDLRSKKILYPHVSHKEHWSAPGADWNPQGCHGVF